MNNHYHWLGCIAMLFLIIQPVIAQNYVLEKLNAGINTNAYDEIAPCVSNDGHTLYFTRVGYAEFDRSLIEGEQDLSKTLSPQAYQQKLREVYSIIGREPISDPVRSGFNQDIWVARNVDGVFDMVYHPSYPLNNALPNSISTIMPSGHDMVVINQFAEGGGMKKGFSRVSQNKKGEWSFPEAIRIDQYHNSGPDVNMTMSADGQTLILAMEREDAVGRSDLYVSKKTGPNSWSMPQNLGPYLNTPYRETTPFLCSDMKTLFYASDRGNNSVGGSDIFVQTRLDDSWKVWSAPKRFRFPVNSRANDSHPYFNEASGHLYFTSNRDGSSDIFRIQIEEPESNGMEIEGVVLNAETMEPMEAAVYASVVLGDGYEVFPTTKKGTFRMNIPHQQTYKIKASKQNFEGAELELAFGQKQRKITLYLKPLNLSASTTETKVKMNLTSPAATLKVGDQIELAPIYFKQSKATVMKESYQELDQLAKFLSRHKNLYIQISGHTDNQGDKALLIKLSEERAEAIKDYLVYKKRINPVRIKTVGFGASKSVNDNSSEKMRKQNRRVEVKVLYVGKMAKQVKYKKPTGK